MIDLRQRKDERPIPPWVTGVGIASGVSAIALIAFGTSAIVQSDHLQSCEPYCASNRKAPLDAAITGADIAAVSFGVTLVATTVLYLVRPTVSREVRITASSAGAGWAF